MSEKYYMVSDSELHALVVASEITFRHLPVDKLYQLEDCFEACRSRPADKLVATVEAAKLAADTLKCVQSAICSMKAVYNEHEPILFGSGMRHDLTNLWNCSEYLKALGDTLVVLEEEV